MGPTIIAVLVLSVPSLLLALFARSALVGLIIGAIVAGVVVVVISVLVDPAGDMLSRDTASDIAMFVTAGGVAGLVAFGLKRLVRSG